MFYKKGRRRPDSTKPIEVQAAPYLKYRYSLAELNFNFEESVKLALHCLNTNAALAKGLDLTSESNLKVLKRWIGNDFANYTLCVINGVEHPELLTMYLAKKFEQNHNPADKNLTLVGSYDKKLIINYQYETKRDAAITYFDQVLGIPTALTVRANLKLKLVDAQKLVEKIDVEASAINLDMAMGHLTAIVNRVVRDTILSEIAAKELSFFELSHHFTLLNKSILVALRTELAESGLEAVDFVIANIVVPDNTQAVLQNQFFAIAGAERVKAHEYRMQSLALDLYERKASIHEKYPHFPLTLTEVEKDLALNRYLNRVGKTTEVKPEVKVEVSEKSLDDRGFVTKEIFNKDNKIGIPRIIR